MSRSYRIKIRESVKRDIAGQDEVCAELELLDILPAEQMRELLAAELKKRGFGDSKGGTLERTRDGVTIAVDPATGSVQVAAAETKEVAIESERETTGFDDFGPKAKELRAQLRAEARKDIDHRVEQHRKKLQEKATEKLQGALSDVSAELDRVVNGVTREALKKKAASLGAIREMSEDAESGSLTIKVEV